MNIFMMTYTVIRVQEICHKIMMHEEVCHHKSSEGVNISIMKAIICRNILHNSCQIGCCPARFFTQIFCMFSVNIPAYCKRAPTGGIFITINSPLF